MLSQICRKGKTHENLPQKKMHSYLPHFGEDRDSGKMMAGVQAEACSEMGPLSTGMGFLCRGRGHLRLKRPQFYVGLSDVEPSEVTMRPSCLTWSLSNPR